MEGRSCPLPGPPGKRTLPGLGLHGLASVLFQKNRGKPMETCGGEPLAGEGKIPSQSPGETVPSSILTELFQNLDSVRQKAALFSVPPHSYIRWRLDVGVRTLPGQIKILKSSAGRNGPEPPEERFREPLFPGRTIPVEAGWRGDLALSWTSRQENSPRPWSPWACLGSFSKEPRQAPVAKSLFLRRGQDPSQSPGETVPSSILTELFQNLDSVRQKAALFSVPPHSYIRWRLDVGVRGKEGFWPDKSRF